MPAPCAIQGQLVDVRNVGTHKCIKLTVHVPAEYARKVIDALGWATGVDPVPVAIARLQPTEERTKPDEVAPAATAHDTARPRAARNRLAMQAGMCANNPVFQRFLLEHKGIYKADKETAAMFIRGYCEVDSRSAILPGSRAAMQWEDLHGQFLAWKLAS